VCDHGFDSGGRHGECVVGERWYCVWWTDNGALMKIESRNASRSESATARAVIMASCMLYMQGKCARLL